MIFHRCYISLLILITLFAWGLRLGVTEKFIGLSAPLDIEDGHDEIDYELFAYEMSIGNGYVMEDGTPTARRAPGTSMVILPIYLLFGRSLLAARIWMTFLSSLNGAAAAWVVFPRWGQKVALLTAAVIAIDPGLFYYSMHLWSEPPYCLAITLGVGCLLRGVNQPNWKWTLLGGLCWGLATLVRPQVVFMGPWLIPALAFIPAIERWIWLRELARQGSVASLMVVPWLIRNQVVMGAFTIATTVGGHTFWGSHNELTFHDPHFQGLWKMDLDDPKSVLVVGTEVEQGKLAWGNGWRCVRQNVPEIPRLLAWKFFRLVTPFEETSNKAVYWTFALAWIVAVPFIAVGLTRMRRVDPHLGWWIGLQAVALVSCTLLFYGAARFRHSMEPFLMMAAAVGFVHCGLFQRQYNRSQPS